MQNENNKTSIPFEHWGVHQKHCSIQDGCKYGNADCPVVLGLELKPEFKIALDRYNSGEKPFSSTFIDEDTITMGYGELDSIGYFEFPLPDTLIRTIKGTNSWSELLELPKQQPKKISDLKKGDVIYDIEYYKVRKYKYLCVHPTGGGNYHILIDECEEPIRIYRDHLQFKLDKDIKSTIDGYSKLADLMEKKAKEIRVDIINKNLT